MASGPVTQLPPPATEQQPCCPRCNSPDTKFCYYNNYNLSQPRHFCKSCRRYWTLGGTLRNVPVGGSTRRHHTSSSNPSRRRRIHHRSTTVQPISAVPPAEADTFAALLTEPLPSGFLALGDPFTHGSSGYRVGFGFDDAGFGVDHRTGWSYYCGDLMGVESRLLPGSSAGAGLCDTWHFSGGGGGAASGCLVWPDIGVSTWRNVE